MDEMRTLIAALSLPGFPEWTGLLLLALVLLCAAAFLLMPFSVFGVKPRLEALEVQLDEIQTEIRELALRLQDPAVARRFAPQPPTDDWTEPPALAARSPQRDAAPRIVPPVPPPAAYPDPRGRAAPRAEPKLDWPRQR